MKLIKINQLPIIRGLAILGVLAVHASSIGVVNLLESNLFSAYNFINIFMKFGTTTFIFLSSLVLFYQYSKKDFTTKLVRNFYKKRILYIIVPYLIFSTMYFAYNHFTYFSDLSTAITITSLIDQILNGTAYYHLYFIFINIQFYVLFPFLLLWAKKKPGMMKYLFIMGIVLQWIFVLLNQYVWQLPNKGSIALSYMTYFTLGATIGYYYTSIKQWLTLASPTKTMKVSSILLWAAWLITGLSHVYIWYEARKFGTQFNPLLYEVLWNVYSILCALVLFQLASIIYSHFRRIGLILTKLGNASFGVYLIHPMLLTLFWRLVPSTGSSTMYHIYIVSSFVLILSISWGITALLSRTPYLSLLIGQPTNKVNDKTTIIK